MIPIVYFAGFQPKHFMFFSFMPVIGLLALTSLILFVWKRRGHPYVITPLIPILWYLYDKFIEKQTNKSQSILLAGVIAVIGIGAIAHTNLVPNTTSAVNASALIGTFVGILFVIYAFIERNK